ncbi:hypothetical protein [Mycobacterium sp.]|uniref:hypothetical protein n=1 Tax=Mycobacterium sp. TaxID=1785 RepID=UPI003BAA5562
MEQVGFCVHSGADTPLPLAVCLVCCTPIHIRERHGLTLNRIGTGDTDPTGLVHVADQRLQRISNPDSIGVQLGRIGQITLNMGGTFRF